MTIWCNLIVLLLFEFTILVFSVSFIFCWSNLLLFSFDYHLSCCQSLWDLRLCNYSIYLVIDWRVLRSFKYIKLLLNSSVLISKLLVLSFIVSVETLELYLVFKFWLNIYCRLMVVVLLFWSRLFWWGLLQLCEALYYWPIDAMLS